jgi:hypothetical protein
MSLKYSHAFLLPIQEYHLQNALDAQRRLGSAKIRAVPIPDLYEDPDSQSIYPSTVELPKQLVRLQRTLKIIDHRIVARLSRSNVVHVVLALQLESDEPEYDMDKIDHDWFRDYARSSCPNLTYLDYETIIDKLENASTRILISFDETRILLPTIDEVYLKSVHEFWSQRRIKRVSTINVVRITFVFYFLCLFVFLLQ